MHKDYSQNHLYTRAQKSINKSSLGGNITENFFFLSQGNEMNKMKNKVENK